MFDRIRPVIPLLLLPLLLALAGCDAVVLRPSGDVALQQRDLVIASTVLMLLIIVPVIVLTALFAWRYRHTNRDAVYDPDWHHSTGLELIIWSAPLLIVIALGALTWIATHTLDPYRRISRIDAQRPLAADAPALHVQVVAMDWKWLFFYPDYGIATVNEMAAPVDMPIDFDLTASSVMNSFYVPALAGQIYAMPGMQTRLHAVINRAGRFEGFSANYSGSGFSHMRFAFQALDRAGFERWVAQVKAGGGSLSRERYLALEKPSEREPVRRYARVDAGLYDAVLNRCVTPGKMCLRDMMAIDARGGLGLAGVYNVSRRLVGDESTDPLSPRREYVTALCDTDPAPLAAPRAIP